MLDGYRSGVITQARLDDALHRILGLKASLGLHRLQAQDRLVRTSGAATGGLPRAPRHRRTHR